MAYDKSNLELDSSIGASSIPARVNIGAYVPRRPWGLLFRSADISEDAGNGKKGTKPSPQQDKAAADAAGRKAASAVPGSESKMAEGNQSPPKAEVDDSPLQHSMNRNKEYDFLLAIRSVTVSRSAFTPPVVETEASLFDRPTATENIDKRKEVAIVSIQGWPRSNDREQEHDGKEEKDEEEKEKGEREGSLEPKNSGDRVLTLTALHHSELILARAMPTHSELNGTSPLPSASDRAQRRLIRLSADTPINTTFSSRFIHVSSYQLSLYSEYDTVCVIGDIYNFTINSSEPTSKSVTQLPW
ncbi:hypothetical protein ALC62_07860 [Cyphomyrmex costatus]|uniref:Uncharacterized protein n=1 Tax=Cyphomyrmex costatus TaxID=456900 RepID=A0A195CKJ2_9HYME|nr:hypothetical protein ALC62_07860 [Cyphomyrmex costatus]